jgi:hypothetical protein
MITFWALHRVIQFSNMKWEATGPTETSDKIIILHRALTNNSTLWLQYFTVYNKILYAPAYSENFDYMYAHVSFILVCNIHKMCDVNSY